VSHDESVFRNVAPARPVPFVGRIVGARFSSGGGYRRGSVTNPQREPMAGLPKLADHSLIRR
jgi:hypothetical protein